MSGEGQAHDKECICDQCIYDCDCDFDPYEDDAKESYHFKRTCRMCGYVWWSFHCAHDGYQNPCGNCGWYEPWAQSPKFTRPFPERL